MRLFGKDKGFTLLEMMIALLILSVSILALSSVTIMTIRTNAENSARNAAVTLVGEVTEDLFSRPSNHADLTIGEHTGAVYNVDVKGINFPYNVDWTVTQPSEAVRQIEIIIRYTVRGQQYTNSAVVFRPN